MSKIGICGAHRCGKTTLAQNLAQHLNIKFAQTNVSSVFAKHNMHAAQTMDFATRLWIQTEILHSVQQAWHKQNFVTDRTSIDFMAYLLAEVQSNTQIELNKLQNYMQQCFAVANQNFESILVVQPGIALVYEDGKAAMNQAYIEHLNTLILGLVHDERLTTTVKVMPRELIDFNARINWVLENVKQ
jgi:nicotinamide riboside kinase